jgi:hypothetical protein
VLSINRSSNLRYVCVLSKGWTAAGELKPGDRIVGLDPRESVAVTALRLTGRQEKLYNLRVADYHTYFVGGSTWGFALWAHNTYKDTFFKVYPELRGRVWVHHAIPQTVLKKYPGLFTRMEIDAFSNLRGIPKEINQTLHLSFLAKAWNRFYKKYPNATRDMIEHYADLLDRWVGHLFLPPRRFL